MSQVAGEAENVEIKATSYGISAVINGDCPFKEALEELNWRLSRHLDEYRQYGIAINLGWRDVGDEQLAQLENVLASLKIAFKGVISMSLKTRQVATRRGHTAVIGRVGLSEHIANAKAKESASGDESAEDSEVEVGRQAGNELGNLVDATPQVGEENTLYLRRDVRSGQSINYDGNIVVVGNVQSRALVRATGDIIILGCLEGHAHAGAGGREWSTIVASLLPGAQVRIASRANAVQAAAAGEAAEGKHPLPFSKVQVQSGRLVVQTYWGE